jgi:serine phosphatase RsbU (regulator of sigma subunit)
MSRIVLLIDQPENRRLLAEWLSRDHDVAAPEALVVPGSAFDLGIVDTASLERYGRWIEGIKRAEHPLFLPFLLVTHRRGVGLETGAWQRFDELIVSPVEKLELHARVETLLRVRALSLTNASLGRRLEKELARAREVQAGLLPRAPPHLGGFDLAARCIPALEIGGDFFDWQSIDDEAVLSVGDVMGKGVPAALLAATVRAVLRALAHQNAPGAALDLLQQTLGGDLERTSSFVTLFHGRLAVGKREVRYVDAGHGHAAVRRADGRVERLSGGGRPIGFPQSGRYRETGLHLAAGDILFVYSDGLIDDGGRGPEDLIRHLDVDRTSSAIVEQLIERAPRPEIADDVTALVLRCT